MINDYKAAWAELRRQLRQRERDLIKDANSMGTSNADSLASGYEADGIRQAIDMMRKLQRARSATP